MGIQALPNVQNASPRSGLHLVVSRPAISERLPFDIPEYSAHPQPAEQDALGCVRGVAVALIIQAFFAVVIFGLWELRHLL